MESRNKQKKLIFILAKPLRGFIFKKAATRLFIQDLQGPESGIIPRSCFLIKKRSIRGLLSFRGWSSTIGCQQEIRKRRLPRRRSAINRRRGRHKIGLDIKWINCAAIAAASGTHWFTITRCWKRNWGEKGWVYKEDNWELEKDVVKKLCIENLWHSILFLWKKK